MIARDRAAARSAPASRRWGGAGGLLVLLLGLALPQAGCVGPQLALLQGGIDSLRRQVDTLQVRDSASYRLLSDLRRDVAEQRDILLSTRATSGSTTNELFQQMGRLEGKLDEVMGRFNTLSRPATPPAAEPGAPDPNQLYEQASQDLTQGRYPLALQEFRDFVQHFPTSDLADNAQYGVGECLFAESKFDSAAIEYQRIPKDWPQGDRVPAALWKLALSQEKMGQNTAARRTLEDLVKGFPLSGEAQLAKDRLGTKTKR